jgi:hypothetical protein
VIDDFAAWRRELLFTGNLVQDGDSSVPNDEAVRRCYRYVELLEMVEGDEPDEVFFTIVESMVAVHDYEVYETSIGAGWRFPPKRFGSLLYRALEDGWLDRDPDRAGCWLNDLASRGAGSEEVRSFSAAWAEGTEFASQLETFVEDQERIGGWLGSSRKRGVLRPAR